MKNKYLKGAHLSERKVRELMKLFCDDLTATQIAGITGISRITVNAYFKLIRTHIARFCEERNPFLSPGTGEAAAFTPTEEADTLLPENGGVKKSFYGIYTKESFVYADKLPLTDSSWLYDWLKGRTRPVEGLAEKYRLDLYRGIADFNHVRLHRLQETGEAAPVRSSADDIDIFWGLLKSRLVKFRGLNGSTLYLHVKETEFRYNYRNRDIYEMLIDILNTQPLHFSKGLRDQAGQMLNSGA